MAGEKEYIVTVNLGVDWTQVHEELTSGNSASGALPARAVEVVKLREINQRNTHYALTDAEAATLRTDTRIAAVLDPTQRQIRKVAFQEGNFNKTNTSIGEQQNWGLLRHISSTNNFGTSTSDPGGSYDYVLDGTGVDVVITDSGIETTHPEWQDANGNSRLQQINWYTESGVAGTQHANHYRDLDGHGTHVTGTAAGKTFGWAKNARIYSMKINGLSEGAGESNTGIPADDVADCLLGWHNAKAGSRPTVMNASWSLVCGLDTSVTPNRVIGPNGTATITGGVYRGVVHSNTTRSLLRSKGLGSGLQLDANTYYYKVYDASHDADLEQLINAGIILCVSAGNQQQKIDADSGQDYDNYVTLTSDAFGDNSFRWYYNRTSTPGSSIDKMFFVGALGASASSSTHDQKVYFSNAGTAVNIYTAGQYISSAVSNTNEYAGTDYYLNSSFKQVKLQGTSMAAPQMSGMAACLLQAHPAWSPTQVVSWFKNNAQDKMYSSALDNDYTTSSSIWGGTQRVAYFPLKGQKPFGYTSS